MRVRAALAGVAAAAASLCAAQTPAPAGGEADARALVRQGRCADAVKALNEDLKKRDPATQVFAGALFESGLCVRKDWSRAERFLLQAADGGSATARMRLVAGYADAAGGKDPAASLWWAHVAAIPRPADCVLARFDPAMEPEAFVRGVQAWGESRLKACAYVGGVVAGTMAALLDSDTAAGAPPTVLRLNYDPGEGRFVGRRIDNGRAVDERRWGVGEALDHAATAPLALLRTVSLAAVRRYGAPPGLDPNWRVDLEVAFGAAR